jgi:carbamoyltransferase
MKILGLYNWHDGGYCVLEDGIITDHIEIERYNRIKASGGDSLQYLIEKTKKNKEKIVLDQVVSVSPNTNLELGGGKKYNTHSRIPKEKIIFYSHHLCHASHSFYSSNFDASLIITIDDAGLDSDGKEISLGLYYGKNNKIVKILEQNKGITGFSLGTLWTKCTRFIFKLSAGYPRGHQAGSVMAMAAFGDPEKYYKDFYRMATDDRLQILIPPPGMIRGWVEPEDDVIHPYLNKYRLIAEKSEQEKMNLAASLQKVTEDMIWNFIKQGIAYIKKNPDNFDQNSIKNLCLSGGVSLNSVMTGKIKSVFSDTIENVFVPPVPYDGGLNIGACQYHYHHVLGKPRIKNLFVSPYLGETYTDNDVKTAIDNNNTKIKIQNNISIDRIVDYMLEEKIISIFQGKSESGRRALGNRSIVADPRSKNMKDLINKKVKHRQWFRPFAPSVLFKEGHNWFENYFESPYMGFVFKIKNEKLGLAPAIEHEDKTARIQTVRKEQNEKYYTLIKKFFEKTGVPMILNTSFNDREPIVETPEHAIDCFLRTNIDYLYFADQKILVERN